MDLRGFSFSKDEIKDIEKSIVQRKLAYQPFQFTDDHEVGEGFAFFTPLNGAPRTETVLWPSQLPSISDIQVPLADRQQFTQCNEKLRQVYLYLSQFIYENIIKSDGQPLDKIHISEFGCNTGCFLFCLQQFGLRRLFGYDLTNSDEFFRLINRKLGSNVVFRMSEWDSFSHVERYETFAETDYAMSIAVMCHLSDPLHHLAFLCSRSRKGVFVWTPAVDSEDRYISFGRPASLPRALGYPLSFDNAVHPTTAMIEETFSECGFEVVNRVAPMGAVGSDEHRFMSVQQGYFAVRAQGRPSRSVYDGFSRRRTFPGNTERSLAYEAYPTTQTKARLKNGRSISTDGRQFFVHDKNDALMMSTLSAERALSISIAPNSARAEAPPQTMESVNSRQYSFIYFLKILVKMVLVRKFRFEILDRLSR